MKFAIYFIPVFLCYSCVTRISTVNFSLNSNESSKVESYLLRIPNGYLVKYSRGGNNESEKRYCYQDSSIIYITSFGLSELNYNNITLLGDSVFDKRMESIKLQSAIYKSINKKYIPEKLVNEGKIMTGLYWKDIREGFLSRGYVNVSEQRKAEFDKALASFKEDRDINR